MRQDRLHRSATTGLGPDRPCVNASSRLSIDALSKWPFWTSIYSGAGSFPEWLELLNLDLSLDFLMLEHHFVKAWILIRSPIESHLKVGRSLSYFQGKVMLGQQIFSLHIP